MRGERQGIVTELRNLGDGTTIVLYTNDNRVYRKVLESVKPIKIVKNMSKRAAGAKDTRTEQGQWS